MRHVTRVDHGDFDLSTPTGRGAEVRDVIGAAAKVDGRSPLNEAALLALRHQGLAGATLFVVGSPVRGFAVVHDHLGTHQDAELNLVVAPEHRGRGHGTALLTAAVSDGRSPLTAWSHGNHPAAAALAARFGFDRVRDLWVMRRSLHEPLPEPAPSAGSARVDVRPFRPGEDEAAFLAVNRAAFAHHPEQGSLSLEDLRAREEEPWFDPAGFFLAWRDGELLGYHWTKVHSATTGEVYVLGIAPGAQGGGLGKLLTWTGLQHLQARGLEEVILYVEADNAPAIAVYSGLGFTHAAEDTDVQYALDRAALNH